MNFFLDRQTLEQNIAGHYLNCKYFEGLCRLFKNQFVRRMAFCPITPLSALSTFLTIRHYRIVILRNNISYLSNIISGSDLFIWAKRWSYSVEGQSSMGLPRLVTFYFRQAGLVLAQALGQDEGQMAKCSSTYFGLVTAPLLLIM